MAISVTALYRGLKAFAGPGAQRVMTAQTPVSRRSLLLGAAAGLLAVSCGGADRLTERLEEDGGIDITDGGIRPPVFSVPDSGVTVETADGSVYGTPEITLTGDRFTEGTAVIEISIIENDGLQNYDFKVRIVTDPTLLDPDLPCVDGLVRLTADQQGNYVSDPADENTRPPIYITGHTLTDLTGSADAPASAAVAIENIKYLGAACDGSGFTGRAGAVAYEFDLPRSFYQSDASINAILRLTMLTEPDKMEPGFESDYQTRFRVLLVPRENV